MIVVSSGWLTLIFTLPDSHLQLIECISVNANNMLAINHPYVHLTQMP